MDLIQLCALVIGLVTMVYWLTAKDKKSKLINMLPGPLSLPLFGTALDILYTPRSGIFQRFDEQTKKFWPIFRVWNGPIPEIHLSSPYDIELILNNTAHIEKAVFYEFLQPWLGTGLLTSGGSKWHSRRKLITPTFHFKILDSFMDVFVEKSDILVKKLKDKADGRGFDIYPFITCCALDIICESAMGTTVHAQEESDSYYVTAVYKMSELTLLRMLRPWMHSDFIFKFTSLGKSYKENLQILHGFTDKIIRERREARHSSTEVETNEESVLGKKKRMAFLDLLLEASESGMQLTNEEIREEVDTFMFEGHDTTSAGISWTLFLLGLHQDVQDKVFEELDSIFQGGDQPPTMHDLQDMKYLDMVIKESLRLYPPVPFIGRTLKEDLKVGSYMLPAGCMISLHIYHVHRNPEYFPDPDKFNPDNFLPEKVRGRHPYVYIPFSAGPRNCIGQRFALLEEKTVISTVIRNYRIRSLDKREDLTLTSELILRPLKGIQVALEPRSFKTQM